MEPKKTARKSISDYLQKEINVTLEEFTKKRNLWKLMKDLRLQVNVTPDHHYTVYGETVIQKDIEITILGPGKLGYQPVGYSNSLSIGIKNISSGYQVAFEATLEEVVSAING